MTKETLKELVKKELTAYEEEIWLTFAHKVGDTTTFKEASRIINQLNESIQQMIDEEI